MKKDLHARAGRAAAFAAALLLSAGCATKHDIRDLRTELAALAVRQDSILRSVARQNAVTQDTLRQQTNQLFDLRGDVSRQLQRILDEIATLRELTGQNQRTIASVRDQLEGLRRAPGVETAAEPGTGDAAFPGVQPAGGAGAAQAMYQAAREQYNRGSLSTAQQAFQAFLQQYANDPNAPDARFSLADILYRQGKKQEALDAFNQIPELHPESARVPDALYRMALIQIDLGKKTDARRTLERVVNTYPDSEAAGPARDTLRTLK